MSIWTFRRCSSLPIVLTEFSMKTLRKFNKKKQDEKLRRKIVHRKYTSMECNEKYPGKVPETIFDLCSMDLIICRSELPTIYGSNFHT